MLTTVTGCADSVLTPSFGIGRPATPTAEIRQRWRDKKHAEGLCTRCGKDVWVYNDGLGRHCGTCRTVKEYGREAYDGAGEGAVEPLLPLGAVRKRVA